MRRDDSRCEARHPRVACPRVESQLGEPIRPAAVRCWIPGERAPPRSLVTAVSLAVNLENRLCNIETDCRNRLHGPVLRIGSTHGDHGT
jgi:hypothetical protein